MTRALSILKPEMGCERRKNNEEEKQGSWDNGDRFYRRIECFLALSETEYEKPKETNPNIKCYAREYLEYGENKEGYIGICHTSWHKFEELPRLHI